MLNSDVFNGFLVSAQNETQRVGGWQDEVPIDVYLMSGQKVTLSVPATLQTDDLLEVKIYLFFFLSMLLKVWHLAHRIGLYAFNLKWKMCSLSFF